jgi:hypothetical protein
MTKPEELHDAQHNNAPDDAEVAAQVSALFARAETVILAAPDIADPSEIGHPTSNDFRVVYRMAMFGGSTVEMNPGAPEALVDDTVSLGGGIAMAGTHSMPAKGAQNRYDDLVRRMLAGDGMSGRVTTVAERQIEIAGQPASVVVELLQRPQDGELQTGLVGLKVYRDMSDGNRFLQYSRVGYPNDFSRAVTEDDAIVNPRGRFEADRDEARAQASQVLPHDPAFPADRPMGFAQFNQLLG